MKRKRAKQAPLMLFWTRRDQRRFIDAVEKFAALVNDLETVTRRLLEAAELAAATFTPRRRTPRTKTASTDNGVSA